MNAINWNKPDQGAVGRRRTVEPDLFSTSPSEPDTWRPFCAGGDWRRRCAQHIQPVRCLLCPVKEQPLLFTRSVLLIRPSAMGGHRAVLILCAHRHGAPKSHRDCEPARC